jgi:hypothetical protein
VDLQSGTFEIELTLESTQYTLLSGFIGMVKIFPSIQKQVFLIPVESLLEANRTSGTVFSWNEETKEIKKIAVQIVTLSEDHVAISSGLEQIDHVIAKGAHYVDEHSNVKVIY